MTMDEQFNNEEKPVEFVTAADGSVYATNVGTNPEITDAPGTEFKTSEGANLAAVEALEAIRRRSFSARHPELGKMINCQVCRRRHRRTDVAFREHFDENGNKTVTLEPLIGDCKQIFKFLWVDEDLETGKLETQYAIVPLPGQKGTPKAILGAAYFAKKRKNPHPSRRAHQFIRLVRRLISDEYTQEDLNDARELAKEMLGWNKTAADKYSKRKQKIEVKNVQ